MENFKGFKISKRIWGVQIFFQIFKGFENILENLRGLKNFRLQLRGMKILAYAKKMLRAGIQG